ncbi:MAG: UDP-N-acetylglucosamine 2-epimerase, partial [Planctomycetota bacterium]
MSAAAETPGAPRPVHVAVCTGGRAEYGILRWVIADLEHDPRFRLSLLVTGAHLSDAHGGTVREIEADGVPIARRIPLELGGVDDPVALLRSVGDASEGVARALLELECDALLVLGDRYEILGAAQGAFFAGVPIAHVAGGDVTEGAFDESIRHALTKLASLHFPTNGVSAARLRRMGEDPARVHVTGTPALDHLRRTPRMTRAELEASLDVELGERNLLVTMHPVTLAPDRGAQQLKALCAALESEPESTRIVWTGVNQDPGNEAFRAAIDAWVAARPEQVRFVQSLGQAR